MTIKSPFPVRAALKHLRAADSNMAQLIKLVGPFKLQTEFKLSPFQALLRAIVFQQLAGAAASAIYARVQALFPNGDAILPAQVLGMSNETLRKAGLSASKAVAVLDLAQKCQDGTVPSLKGMHSLDDETLVRQLTTVRGVGRWTVEIMMIHKLARPDVLPVSDLGIRKGHQLAYGYTDLLSPAALAIECEHYSPYRSIASWYLWRATDSVDWVTE